MGTLPFSKYPACIPLRYERAFFLVWMRLNWILSKLKFLLILQMKWSVVSSPALLILYLVTLSSAEESKGKTPVDLKVPLTSTLVCCIYEFPFFLYDICLLYWRYCRILYRHDVAYLYNVNVLYRAGFEENLWRLLLFLFVFLIAIHMFIFSRKGSGDWMSVFL